MRVWLALAVVGFVAGHVLSAAQWSGKQYPLFGPFRHDGLDVLLPVGAAFVAPALVLLLTIPLVRAARDVAYRWRSSDRPSLAQSVND